jgi:AbrB family looped-hinge helix DNA binding protein
MTTLVKIHRKGQMTLPSRLRSLAGITEGDLVEATFKQGKIVITPKLVIDRSQFPNADDEYTPAQRRVIDARLAKADADIKSGRVSRVFDTHAEFIADLHREAKKLGAKRTKPSPR